MTMSYTSLVASKGAAGSIMNWVSYTKLDVNTVVDEAQSLLYTMLRVREMRSSFNFGIAAKQASVVLPTRFLDPIGKIYDNTNSIKYSHVSEVEVLSARAYDNSLTGTFGTNPFATTVNTTTITATFANHSFTQDSAITIPNGPTVNGLLISGTFNVSSIIDANTFTFGVADAQADGTQASATGTGGGTGVTFTGNALITGMPSIWSVWAERLHFDCAFVLPASCKMLYYRSPLPLSATNLTNFVTNRYPLLMRKACQAAAADYMKDDTEYQKQVTALGGLIQTITAQDDLIYRGAEFGTDTP